MIRDLIRQRRERGTTVFLTTHDMTVADELCDRVALIVDGRIAVTDSPRRLKLGHAARTVRVEYRIAEPDAAGGVVSAEGRGSLRVAEFSLGDPAQKQKFLRLVRDTDPETIHTTEPTLEDVFLRITGSELGGHPGQGDARK